MSFVPPKQTSSKPEQFLCCGPLWPSAVMCRLPFDTTTTHQHRSAPHASATQQRSAPPNSCLHSKGASHNALGCPEGGLSINGRNPATFRQPADGRTSTAMNSTLRAGHAFAAASVSPPLPASPPLQPHSSGSSGHLAVETALLQQDPQQLRKTLRSRAMSQSKTVAKTVVFTPAVVGAPRTQPEPEASFAEQQASQPRPIGRTLTSVRWPGSAPEVLPSQLQHQQRQQPTWQEHAPAVLPAGPAGAAAGHQMMAQSCPARTSLLGTQQPPMLRLAGLRDMDWAGPVSGPISPLSSSSSCGSASPSPVRRPHHSSRQQARTMDSWQAFRQRELFRQPVTTTCTPPMPQQHKPAARFNIFAASHFAQLTPSGFGSGSGLDSSPCPSLQDVLLQLQLDSTDTGGLVVGQQLEQASVPGWPMTSCSPPSLEQDSAAMQICSPGAGANAGAHRRLRHDAKPAPSESPLPSATTCALLESTCMSSDQSYRPGGPEDSHGTGCLDAATGAAAFGCDIKDTGASTWPMSVLAKYMMSGVASKVFSSSHVPAPLLAALSELEQQQPHALDPTQLVQTWHHVMHFVSQMPSHSMARVFFKLASCQFPHCFGLFQLLLRCKPALHQQFVQATNGVDGTVAHLGGGYMDMDATSDAESCC